MISSDMTVFIPTLKRIGINKQITLRELLTKSSIKPIIVCPEDEVMKHAAYHPSGSAGVWGCPVPGIGPTRQWILEQSETEGVVMLDDDLYFSQRQDPNAPRPLIRSEKLDPMFDWIQAQLDAGFVHGGISARQGNQNIMVGWTDCIRVNNAHFFNAERYLNEKMRFDNLPVMEDFDVTLSLLLRGYPNRVAYHYCWSQRGSGLEGGCSGYRTKEVQAQAAMMLQNKFPEFVKQVTKTSISGGELFAGERQDVNIQWLKAWNARSTEDNLPRTELQLKRK